MSKKSGLFVQSSAVLYSGMFPEERLFECSLSVRRLMKKCDPPWQLVLAPAKARHGRSQATDREDAGRGSGCLGAVKRVTGEGASRGWPGYRILGWSAAGVV